MALEVLLSLNEVAELEDKSYEDIRKKVQRNKLQAIKMPTEERKGFEYRVKLDDLTEKAKRKYYARLKSTDETGLSLEVKKEEKYSESIEELTAKQRQEVAYWKKVLQDWRKYICEYKKETTEMTEEFIRLHNIQNPRKSISARTLRQKWKNSREYGDVALADHRANRKDKGKTKLNEVVFSVFLQWWLNENQPTLSHVYRVTNAWAEMRMPELLPLPSEDTFRRAVEQVPKPVLKYFREGMKEFEDHCLPYLVRMYDFIFSNDIWTADYHTLDMMVRDDVSGKVFRPHLIVWEDIRSRKMLSLKLCESSNSDGVILAFRDAVKPYGIPKEVYLDNGREFLVSDFGGRGRRKTDDNAGYGSTILERLGTGMINAKVKNARAKVIERAFREITEGFAKLYITYCGNRPENRPERHNQIMKDIDNIPLLSEVERDLRLYIEGWHNMKQSKAAGLGGKSPNEVYAENLVVKRTATEKELNLLLARSARLQSVERNGVYLKFGEKKIFFYDEDMVQRYFKQKVYVRYDSDDLSGVRIYDEEERYIGVAHRLEVGGYEKEQNKEAIKKINSKAKKMKNLVKEFIENQEEIIEAPLMKDILLEKARKNLDENRTSFEAKVIEPYAFANKAQVGEAVGGTDVIINWNTMIHNAGKGRKEEE